MESKRDEILQRAERALLGTVQGEDENLSAELERITFCEAEKVFPRGRVHVAEVTLRTGSKISAKIVVAE